MIFPDKKLYENALKAYCGSHLFDLINKNGSKQLSLGMERRYLTICCHRIFHLRIPGEKVTPEFLIELLNTFFASVIISVEKNNGIIITIDGDEVISVFGYDDKNPELNACKATLQTNEDYKNFLSDHDLENINIIGTGIHSGNILIGNVGSKNRIFYSIFGDDANLASRLSMTNKIYNTCNILSQSTLGKITNQILFRELDSIRVKGKNEPLAINELVGIK